MANKVFIATSIDGYIATIDGGIEWLEKVPNPEKSDFGYAAFMDGIDAIVMGRKTFEKVCSFESWPFTKKVFVLSTTLKGIPQNLESVAEIVRGELKDLVHQLSEKGFKNLYIDGGKTFQSFLKENLIDELIISTIPIVVGNGIPLFGTLEHSIEFEHQVTKAFAGGLVQSRYIKV